MNKSEKIRLIYGIVLSVLTAAVGIVFIIKIADLYYSGVAEGIKPYSVERIQERLVLPLVFLFVWIAAIIAGFVLSVVFPVKEKRRAYVNDKKTLATLKSRMPEKGGEEFEKAKKNSKFQSSARIWVWGITCAILLVCALFILIYVFTPSHFSKATMKEDILAFVRHVLIWVGVGLICSIAAVIIDRIAIKREIAHIKKAIATGERAAYTEKTKSEKLVTFAAVITGIMIAIALALFISSPAIIHSSVNAFEASWQYIVLAAFVVAAVVAGFITYKAIKKYVPEKAKSIYTLCTRVIIGVTAVTFIIVGIFNEGAQDVLNKAIAICTECIGLG